MGHFYNKDIFSRCRKNEMHAMGANIMSYTSLADFGLHTKLERPGGTYLSYLTRSVPVCQYHTKVFVHLSVFRGLSIWLMWSILFSYIYIYIVYECVCLSQPLLLVQFDLKKSKHISYNSDSE